MKFTLDTNTAAYLIKGYDNGQVTINDEVLTDSLIVSPQQLIRDWHPRPMELLVIEDLEAALQQSPEILVLGTGATHRFPAAELMATIMSRNIGLEVMDTPAACRTYNVLISEDRNVVAALII